MSSEDSAATLDSTSSPPETTSSSLPTSLAASAEKDKRRKIAYEKPDYKRVLSEDELKDELKIYYDRLFPTSLLYHWLSTNSADGMKYREMSFTLAGDIYVRYCSYARKEDLKTDLVTKCPVKIDIGAIYNAPPNMHASVSAFTPLSKELVFDIDMTDYDDIRRCCSEAKICHKCWQLMTAAIKVIHDILTKDFGFQHILVVFSGRRGVHFWVADPKAKSLNHDARSAIVDYLSVYMGKERKVQLGSHTLHPTLARSYEILKPYFHNMLEDQGWLDTNKDCAKILEFFDPAAREEFYFDDEDADSISKWEELEKKVKQFKLRKDNAKKYNVLGSLQTVLPRIVFSHVYPRLDVNVSKHLNHLLKAPFCIHPKTGKVCVPIDPEKVDDFDPEKVPTILQLHDELNIAHERGGLGDLKPWEVTSLKPHIEYFRDFVTKLLTAQRDANLLKKQQQIKKEETDAEW